jgi:hypothetical protein
MLLRRITQNVKAQNWFAVGLDFFIVVAGVLLALQVSNWNEARSSRDGATNTLVRLKNEAAFNIATLDDRIESIENSRSVRNRAMRALAQCDGTAEAMSAVSETIYKMTGDILPSFVDSSLRELGRSDQYLDLLTEDFRAALNIYDARLADERSQLEINYELMWDDHVVRNPAVYLVAPEGDIRRASVAFYRPMAELCEDPIFRRQLIMTEGWHQAAISRMTRFKEQSETFLQDIDAEMARLQ